MSVGWTSGWNIGHHVCWYVNPPEVGAHCVGYNRGSRMIENYVNHRFKVIRIIESETHINADGTTWDTPVMIHLNDLSEIGTTPTGYPKNLGIIYMAFDVFRYDFRPLN